MYLSRLILNPRSRHVRRDLADCHELHRTLLAAFPTDLVDGQSARAGLGVLYRQETHPRSGLVALLVQSRAAPDWGQLPADYLLDTTAEAINPSCKPIDAPYAALRAGMHLAFRLRANPTRKVDTRSGPDGERRNGRRVALRDDVARLAWLQRKAGDGGFHLVTVRTAAADVPNTRERPEPDVTGRRERVASAPGSPPVHRLTFGAALFEGELEIVDADRFRHTLEHGLGSGKAYGFGLLSVAPIRS